MSEQTYQLWKIENDGNDRYGEFLVIEMETLSDIKTYAYEKHGIDKKSWSENICGDLFSRKNRLTHYTIEWTSLLTPGEEGV